MIFQGDIMKRFNVEHLLNFIVLFSLVTALFYLIKTGNINNFLHPHMQKLTLISLGALIILTINEFFNIFSMIEKKKLNIIGYEIFFVTIIIGMFASVGGMHVHENTNKNVVLNFTEKSNNIKGDTHESVNVEAIAGGSIIIDEKNYLYMIGKINEDKDAYKRKSIVLEGFIFKNDSFKNDEFITARFVMKSSAIDTQIVGMLCKYKDSSKLKINDWVRVEGVIDYEKVSERDLTVLKVKKVNKIEKPENSYIY